MKNKHMLLFLCLLLGLFSAGMFGWESSEIEKVVVKSKTADVYLKMDSTSLVIRKVPEGVVLNAERIDSEWFKVTLPADDQGFTAIGFIRSSDIAPDPTVPYVLSLKNGETIKGRIIAVSVDEVKVDTGSFTATIKTADILEMKPAEDATPKDTIKAPTTAELRLQRNSNSRLYPIAKQKKFEISLFGGYQFGFGVLAAENRASDLLAGRWSPWFGKGYKDFHWGSLGPDALDDVIGGANLEREPGALAGIKLGFHLTPEIQLELFYQYCFSGFRIETKAWDRYEQAMDASLDELEHYGDDCQLGRASIQSSGNIHTFGFDIHIGFRTATPFLPYFSAGVGMMTISNLPLLSYDLTRHSYGSSTYYGRYTLDVSYSSKSLFFFQGGAGVKIELAEGMGINLAALAHMPLASFDKSIKTTFKKTTSRYTDYTDYDNMALTEKGIPFTIGGIIGLFFLF